MTDLEEQRPPHPLDVKPDADVWIDYTPLVGERAWWHITPVVLRFVSRAPWDSTRQWHVIARDHGTKEMRLFILTGINEWRRTPPEGLTK
jgi:hypothetical protein